MLQKTWFCLALSIGFIWVFTVSGAEIEKEKETPKEAFKEYLAGEETPVPQEETPENELLAPVAKPVVTVIEGVGAAVEPLLEEKEIKDEKGETKATIKPKEGKVQVEF